LKGKGKNQTGQYKPAAQHDGKHALRVADANIFSQDAQLIEDVATPRPAAVTTATGNVDILSAERIAGWAWNPGNPGQSVVVNLFDGTDLLCSVRANLPRSDLAAAGIGSGQYGFEIPDPSSLLPQARHLISVRIDGDAAELPGSPRWISRRGAIWDQSVTEVVESAARASVKEARHAEDLDAAISASLRTLNQMLNARHLLLNQRTESGEIKLQKLLADPELSDWTRDLVSKLDRDYKPLHFESVDEPIVSIIVPVHNRFRTTYNCLESIARHLPDVSFELIVVDDGSYDETLFAGFLISGGVQVVRCTSNKGFVSACNQGARVARGRYLFFLNNDTLVKPGWLDELVATFTDLPNIGIAGSKLLFEDGSLQEAGGIIWNLGEAWNWGRNADAHDPRFCYLRDTDYVSGAALMIERSLFEDLQGFDDYYSPAYYEDSDLCFRVRARGRRVVVQPASQIVHLEGVSAGKDVDGGGMKRFQALNRRKFYRRWKATLSSHRTSGVQPDLEVERNVALRAYFIDDTVPTPDQDAGSNAALQHMLALMRMGYKITFVPADNMARIDPYTANLQKIGVECLYAPQYRSVEGAFRRAPIAPDLVYLHRYSNASKYISLTRNYFPKAFAVYNVADLHFLRQQRELRIEGALNNASPVSEEDELSVMREADAIIVHSHAERQLILERAPSLRVHTVPWTVQPRPNATPFQERSGYAFVGSYSHRPNVDAAKHLAHDIAPLLRSHGYSFLGLLVGSKPPQEVMALASSSLKVMGFVPDLTGLLHRIRCTVAPLRYGAGLKGKILESLAHGIPCVMSEIAAEGIALPKELKWLVAGSSEDFALKLIQLHEDEGLNARLSDAGLRFIQESFSARVTQSKLAEAIDPKVQIEPGVSRMIQTVI
jgi:GT2 family glycosyltransferase/glycosyltransferase involved in cell wall biosynthesis